MNQGNDTTFFDLAGCLIPFPADLECTFCMDLASFCTAHSFDPIRAHELIQRKLSTADLADALRSEIAMLTGETLAPVTDVASVTLKNLHRHRMGLSLLIEQCLDFESVDCFLDKKIQKVCLLNWRELTVSTVWLCGCDSDAVSKSLAMCCLLHDALTLLVFLCLLSSMLFPFLHWAWRFFMS